MTSSSLNSHDLLVVCAFVSAIRLSLSATIALSSQWDSLHCIDTPDAFQDDLSYAQGHHDDEEEGIPLPRQLRRPRGQDPHRNVHEEDTRQGPIRLCMV